MESHEAANIFQLDEEGIGDLAADIAKNGLMLPIETLDGKILDGRRRFMACQKAEVDPRFQEIRTDDPVAYVLSLNLHRRHLAPSQRAMVGARAREMYDRQAKERQREAGKTHGRGKEKVVENLPQPISDSGKARDAVGKAVGVSGKSIDYATKVLTNAIPEVVKAVDEGRMAISTAAILSSEPEEVQKRDVEVDANGRKRGRRYLAGQSNGKGTIGENKPENKEPEPEPNPNGKLRGVGVIRANEAVNCLIRIPKNDVLRKRGFQIVTDWIKANQ